MESTGATYFLKILIFAVITFYMDIKLVEDIRKYKVKNKILFILGAICIATICEIFDNFLLNTNNIIYLITLTSIIYAIISKNKFGYSILVNIISSSINIIILFFAIILGYVLHEFLDVNNKYMEFLLIMVIYLLSTKYFMKIRKIRNGMTILKKNKENEYFNMIILNISGFIIFLTIIVTYSQREFAGKYIIWLIIFSILMFITIQKSLQLYYKQKMLIKDLEETKAELENKRKEVEELEKENLNFSKVSHSIAHKQKSLEFKLNELSMKSEISSEINLKDRVDKLGKALTKETISVIDKTGIEEIDDMLKYMQAECIKNKIDFQLQLSGNIYTMINHYIDKEELEILLADHIKNAIIAISYTDNLNKSILVRLGKLDGYYGLYIYDSGIEFEVKTLYKLGKIPATTHKDNGGTGMGFMNTFDTLRKHKASFVIEEYGKPVKNNFTKALKFIFNEKNEFKIYSYRWEEIRRENKEDNFVIEKLNI